MAALLRVMLLLSGILVLASAAGYDGFKIYELTPRTFTQCKVLLRLYSQEDVFDFFKLSRSPNETARVMVQPDAQEELLELLQQHDISYEVINENVGESFAGEYAENRALRLRFPYLGRGRLGTERYYSHSEINAYIEDAEERHPKRVSVKTVGKSYEGRLLKTITITNGDGRTNKNVILVDGGFHAREWISPAAVLYVIEQLVDHASENADLLLDYDWVILPVVNADGYEYTQQSATKRMWRKTRKPNEYNGKICYGTDPNRNFGFHWNEEGSSPNACAETYAGPKAFSEPETIVMRDVIHTFRERGIMYLTVHSYGNYLLYPWGWSADLPDTWPDLDEVAQAGANAIREATGTKYTVGSSTTVLYVAAGASDDYAFNEGFPISFTMELPGGGSAGFNPPASSIDGYVKETWIGIRAMAQKVVQKYPLKKIL